VIVGLIATVLIFAPGLLLVTALLPVWQAASQYRLVRRAVPGINAAVVGLLAAALWNPVIVSGITRPVDVGIALTAFILLWRTPTPPWVVVPGCALARAALGYLPSIA
jgi:chromate transporter